MRSRKSKTSSSPRWPITSSTDHACGEGRVRTMPAGVASNSAVITRAPASSLSAASSAPIGLAGVMSAAASRQEALPIRELARQVLLEDEVEAPLRERLLLGAHAHLEHLLDRGDPRLVRHEEGVVLERVLGALDVDL